MCGTATEKNDHEQALRADQLDVRLRQKLDTNDDGIVTEPEFRLFLDTVRYEGPWQKNNGSDNFYGYCDDAQEHSHSGKVIFVKRRVRVPFLVLIRDHYEVDPALVEEFLKKRR